MRQERLEIKAERNALGGSAARGRATRMTKMTTMTPTKLALRK